MNNCCCVELAVTEDAEVLLSVAEDSQIALDVQEQFVDGGGGVTPTGTKTINVTENGTTTTDVTYYANAKVVAAVPNTYTDSDEGKVVDSRALVAQTTMTANTNDVYNTTTVKQVTVAVPASAVDTGTKSISTNGNHDVVGYAAALVAVPASAVDSGTKNITANGNNQDVVGYAAVNVSVPNTYAAADEDKVVHNGILTIQNSATYTSNNTYDTTLIKSVTVAVPGSSPTGTKEISITANGTTTEDVAAYADAEITVAVPNTYAAGDEGKVVSSGALVAQTSTTKSANGTYDTTTNNQVVVSVPASAVDSGTKNITANGTGQDVVGYAAVDVAVPNSYSAGDEGKVVSNGALVAQTSDTVTTNDTYDTTLINSLTVNVSGGGGSGEQGTITPASQTDTLTISVSSLYTYVAVVADSSYSGMVASTSARRAMAMRGDASSYWVFDTGSGGGSFYCTDRTGRSDLVFTSTTIKVKLLGNGDWARFPAGQPYRWFAW